MKQAPRFDGLLLDPFSLFQDGVATPEVDVCGCQVLQALVVSPVVVILDEGFDLLPEVAWQVVVLQQNAVLQGLVPALDLALSLRVIRCASNVVHLLILEPIANSLEM